MTSCVWFIATCSNSFEPIRFMSPNAPEVIPAIPDAALLAWFLLVTYLLVTSLWYSFYDY